MVLADAYDTWTLLGIQEYSGTHLMALQQYFGILLGPKFTEHTQHATHVVRFIMTRTEFFLLMHCFLLLFLP